MGSLGSFGGSNYAGTTSSWADEYQKKRRANGEYEDKRNMFKKNDQSDNMSKGEAVGNGQVASQSNNEGGMIQAKGEKASKGMTRSSGLSDFFGDSFQMSLIGGQKNKVRKINSTKENSKGMTMGEAIGNGTVEGMSNRFEGAKSRA